MSQLSRDSPLQLCKKGRREEKKFEKAIVITPIITEFDTDFNFYRYAVNS